MQPIAVNYDQCQALGKRLAKVSVRPDEFVVQPTNREEKRREANLWFYLIAICQSTRTLQGTLDGKWYRGWDYMLQAARRMTAHDPDYFSAQNMSLVTPDGVRSIFSDDFLPEHSTIDRVDERVAQLHDCAQILLRSYEGDVCVLHQQAGGRLQGENGILKRFSVFIAYSDPVQKKSFLFLMFAAKSGVWELTDLDSLKVAIDYHIMRIALRSGMVQVLDPELAETLRTRREVNAETDNQIRETIREACDLLIEHSGHTVFDVDNILWMMGRNCCFYDHAPICGDNPCTKMDKCSFVRGIEYACPGHCLFDGVCFGSYAPAYQAYWETTLYTEYY